MRPRAVFGAVLVAGLLCGLATPPFAGFDEGRHFAHAWQISDGRVFPLDGHTATGSPAQGGFLPSGVARDLISLFDAGQAHEPVKLLGRLTDPASHGRPVFVDFSNVASYSFVPYLPAAAAIRIGRLFGASTLMLLLLARLFGLLAYAALAALAVARSPTRRGLVAVLLLTPVAIVQASTLSADGVTIGLAILVVAEAMRLAAPPREAVSRAESVEAAVVLVALALAKPPYALFGLLYVVAMLRRRGSVARVLAVGAGSGAVLALGWNAWSARHYVNQYFGLAQLDPHFYAFRGVNASRQLGYVATHPWSFVGIVFRTLQHSGGWIVHDAVMQSPAWQGVPALTTTIELVILAAAVAVAADVVDVSSLRAIGAATIAISTIAVFVLAYAGWNELHAPRIDALDGRYFFPIIAMALLVVAPVLGARWPELARRISPRAVFVAQLAFVVCVAGVALHHSYGPSGHSLRAVPTAATAARRDGVTRR